MIILMFKSSHGLVPNYLYVMKLLCSRTLPPKQRDLRTIIMFMCDILFLNVAKMHLPIEVPFYGLRFQNMLRSVNRSMVLNNVSNYT